ncbi:hypothetical protein Pmani_028850 [Petrolisthes manimaculis]|uniref:Vps16 C-terminal domain-containing protein n=1 Tax=Petrolisthes manimaculis TaxID=1843537 RepID=A0AAE1TV28_9EUCA|nr:hypothetical protein Pmani_028850 [Petrolisthes manimaculis]
MNRAENEAYWGSTDTAPSALDSFFDEDSEVSWRGSSGAASWRAKSDRGEGKPEVSGASPSSSGSSNTSYSIVDNITVTSTQDWAFVEVGGSGTNSGRSVAGVGKAIGEKLDSWKPPSVSIKWNSSQGQGSSCAQCVAKDNEIIKLKKRLENSFSRYNLTLPPEDTVKRILLGQPYSLECYRSHEDKIALLDTALATLDGSAILASVIHLKNTVKKTLFVKEMQTRPHAVQVYVSYLKKRHNYPEAIDFLGLLGKTEEAAILSYELALTGKAPEGKLKNFKKLLETNFSHPGLAFEASMVEDNIKLLSRQLTIDEVDQKDQSNPMLAKYPRAANVAGKPLLTTLFYCCMYHWEAGESHPGSPLALRKEHDLTSRQLLWTVLRGRARVHHWPLPQELDAWKGNKGLLGALGSLTSALGGSGRVGTSTVKAKLPIDQLVRYLATSGAPSNILAVYIGLVDPIGTRLTLALNHKCHQAVIDVYVIQKDKGALEKYMKEIPEGLPEYLKAENALKTAKWKL